jgi:hypothetical protein
MITGPYETGRPDTVTLAKESAGLAVSSTSDPAIFADGEILSAVCGHPIYADAELDRLAKQQGNAAALAAGYRKMGSDVLQLLHGNFCIALVNYKQESVIDDRYGSKAMSSLWLERTSSEATSSRRCLRRSTGGLQLRLLSCRSGPRMHIQEFHTPVAGNLSAFLPGHAKYRHLLGDGLPANELRIL